MGHCLHQADTLRRRQNISGKGTLFITSPCGKKQSSSFTPKSQLQHSCLLPLSCKALSCQLWQHQQEQSQHHWRVSLAGMAAGSNVQSVIWEANFSFLFFSLRLLLLLQEDDLAAHYLLSIFCICRLSDVKLARRSVTSST